MQEFSFFKDLFLRSPIGGPECYTLDVEKILANELFISAVSVASPSFYKKILSGKIHDARSLLTLRRYYNRFCFRPTPFGLFASVSHMDWSSRQSDQEHDRLSIFVNADQHLSQLIKAALEHSQNDLYEVNPTLYPIQREFRFVFTDTNLTTGKRQYLLQATDKTTTLARILRYSKSGRSRGKLLELIKSDSRCNHAEAEEYLAFLIDSQILLSQNRPVITGPPDILSQFPEAGHTYHPHSNIISDLREAAVRSFKVVPDDIPLLNVISFRERASCLISDHLRETLNDGLWALMQLTPPLEVPHLARFAEQFKECFEGQMIPLLEVLDAETGIPYGSSEREKDNPLLETLHIDRRHQYKELHEWTGIHRFLLNAWHDQINDGNDVIDLDRNGLEQLGQRHKSNEGATGFGILFRALDDQVWIESVGGYHTNSLLGRFTLASNGIRDAARKMAAHEQRLNPHIIFAEILHLTDLHTDNVNRRAHILDMEIPVTASSTVPKNRQIALSDLMVCVQDGQVLLRSVSHDRYVIPRQSSAYNHVINDLPLFRFLADIPYQYAAPLRTLDLSELFPGLAHYPRVMYKRCVLASAKWILDADEIDQIKEEPHQFARLKKERQLPDLFLLCEGDQQLLFDSRSEAEVMMFISCIKRNSQIILQEVPKDRTGLPVCDQLNAFILPVDPLKLPKGYVDMRSGKLNKRKFIPGSEWLYLKIYTSRLGANAILKQLGPFLRRQLRQGSIMKWFFVRYEDHAPHLRVRFQVDPAKLGQILAELRGLFESKVAQNIIREFQLDTYSRELERYGISSFEEVENHFYASSMLVQQYFAASQFQERSDSILFALAVTNALILVAFPDEEKRINFYKLRYEQFKGEFNDEKLHVALDQKYRSLKADINGVMMNPNYFSALRLKTLFFSCLKTFRNLIEKAGPDGSDRHYLVSSLVHMHLNRQFITESRKQEMAAFYFLLKYSAGMRAKRKRHAETD